MKTKRPSNARVKKLHEKRRKAKVCIEGGSGCGPIWKSDRCKHHYDKVLANKRRYRRESKERLARQAAERKRRYEEATGAAR